MKGLCEVILKTPHNDHDQLDIYNEQYAELNERRKAIAEAPFDCD
jgi:hypothetical protein